MKHYLCLSVGLKQSFCSCTAGNAFHQSTPMRKSHINHHLHHHLINTISRTSCSFKSQIFTIIVSPYNLKVKFGMRVKIYGNDSIKNYCSGYRSTPSMMTQYIIFFKFEWILKVGLMLQSMLLSFKKYWKDKPELKHHNFYR